VGVDAKIGIGSEAIEDITRRMEEDKNIVTQVR
jgi:hypothetical protein